MNKVLVGKQVELVRTTIRLPKDLYEDYRRRSYTENQTMQALITATLQSDKLRRQRYTTPTELFAPKYNIRLKKGQRLPTRSELYDEVLEHRVRTR